MNHHDDRHCIETPWSEKRFYNGNYASGEKGPFDRVELTVRRSYPSISFEMPRQQHELQKIDQMLSMAYERGRADNRTELAKLLKELIAIT